ncbi:MAG TPA: NYN domain-containing protein, partial [Candidatus Paceibacterota bacterium]
MFAPKEDIAFERIVSIEYDGIEQVWDIAVSGTHNFVANGIVAHNTYLGTASATGVFTSTATGANTFPYASSTALTVSGTGYFGTASTTNLTVSALTSGRVPYITTAGAFTDSANLTFDGATLTANALTLTTDLAVTEGGTGASTLTGLLQGNGASAITGITGTAGQFPYYNGTDTLLATSTLFLATSGNVGIGTTSPATTLSVAGNGYLTGGLGVGVLNTTSNTFRVGQCVTGDTKLRRRRRRKDGSTSLTAGDPYEYDEVEIQDVEAGDEIQSLDEKTGALVWSRVKQLAFMGVKQTYRITTEDGRSIRTTANHPYLTRQGWKKVKYLAPGLEIAVADQSPSGASPSHSRNVSGSAIISRPRNRRAVGYAASTRFKDAITTWLRGGSILMRMMPKNSRGSNLRMFEKSESCVTMMRFSRNTISPISSSVVCGTGRATSYPSLFRNLATAPAVFSSQSNLRDIFACLQKAASVVQGGFDVFARELGIVVGSSDFFNGNTRFQKFKDEIHHDAGILEGGLAVADARIGDDVVIDVHSAINITPEGVKVQWSRIVSIEAVAEEDVYDVEIEGTHNFIGNGIVAHNTAFLVDSAGNVGIGTTSPSHALTVANATSPQLSLVDTTLTSDAWTLRSISNSFYLATSTYGATSTTAALAINQNGAATFGSNLTVGGTLAVNGLCVAGDTKLRRRRKRRRPDGSLEEYFEDVEIKDIKEGDEILTLDQKTGKLVVSRVKQLAFMGTKDIFELVTATGKRIRTTGNHPYLVAPKLPEERVAIFIDGANIESAIRHMNARVDYKNLYQSFGGNNEISFAGFYQAYFRTEGQERFFGRLKHLGYSLITKPLKIIKQKGGKDLPKANFDVEIACDACLGRDQYDTAILFSGDSDFAYLAEQLQKRGKRSIVIAPYRATGRELRTQTDVFLNIAMMPFVEFNTESRESDDNRKGPRRGHHTRLSPALPILEQVHPFVKGGVWKKVVDIREGQMIATQGAGGKPQYERIV